jgi:hypothetical protein
MATKIMFVRHAEKPSDDDSIRGVSAAGKHNPDELSVRGWQRSGALVRFFAPPNGQFSHPGLATPDIIFACAPTDHCKSLRSQHTVLALSEYLNKTLNVQYSRDQEKALSEAARAADGVVLIAWEHNAIPDIANRIARDETTCPQRWHDSRFDLVWLLDRQPDSGWEFTQIAQMLLPGDLAHAVAAPAYSAAPTRVTGTEAG